MKKQEFEKQYAEASGMTVDQLHELNLHAIPCDCEETGCQGWAMNWENRE